MNDILAQYLTRLACGNSKLRDDFNFTFEQQARAHLTKTMPEYTKISCPSTLIVSEDGQRIEEITIWLHHILKNPNDWRIVKFGNPPIPVTLNLLKLILPEMNFEEIYDLMFNSECDYKELHEDDYPQGFSPSEKEPAPVELSYEERFGTGPKPES